MNEKIAGYQLEIDRLKDQLAKVERRGQETGTQTLLGLVGFALGAALAYFGSGTIFVIGAILALAGILAVITQALKRMNAGEEARQIEKKIEDYRRWISRELNNPS